MHIAVLGGGHGCYAAAADLTEQGHEVRLWRRSTTSLGPLLERPVITIKDAHGEREVSIWRVCADIGDAVEGAELIVIPTPATAQADIARAMAPHLRDGQVVFLPPGTFGSVLMDQVVREHGCKADVTWAETGTLPWLARKHGPTTVAITIRATRLPTGFFPQHSAQAALPALQEAFPSVEHCGDALSGALMNAGPIIHPPLILMNAGPLQHFAEWDIHNEGTQPAIRAVTDKLDLERIRVREALGYGEPHFPLRDHYENDRWMYGDAHQALVDSGDWREHIDLYSHRYMREDTLLGLDFLVSVARWARVHVPIATGLLAMAGAILEEDVTTGGRSLAQLGLADLSREQMTQLLQTGEEPA